MNDDFKLKIYRKALIDYIKAYTFLKRFSIDDNWKQAYHAGFCHYFYTVHKHDFRNNPFKELYETRPINTDNKQNWFPKGKKGLKNRIICLIKAIILLKNKMKRNESKITV